MLKDAKRESGCSWDHTRQMLQVEPFQWDNLITSYPKIKKFRNSKATFPLFDDLGQLAEGAYNFTSAVESLQDEAIVQTKNANDIQDLEEVQWMEEVQNEASEGGQRSEEILQRSVEAREEEVQIVSAEPRGQKRSVDIPKEPKKAKKSSHIENMMERYLEMRAKQVEEETAQLAQEKEGGQGQNFSITKCIAVLNTLDVTKEEKAKVLFSRTKRTKKSF